MIKNEFLDNVRFRLIQITVGASALRNQGKPGIVQKTRDYLWNRVSLQEFFESLPDQEKYDEFLNAHTDQLRKIYRIKGGGWGTARKSLNLYFRELVYNKFITEHFDLPTNYKSFGKLISNLEVPLDKQVASGIQKEAKELVPKWQTIVRLEHSISHQYQKAASAIAIKKGIAKVHLDLEYWRKAFRLPADG